MVSSDGSCAKRVDFNKIQQACILYTRKANIRPPGSEASSSRWCHFGDRLFSVYVMVSGVVLGSVLKHSGYLIDLFYVYLCLSTTEKDPTASSWLAFPNEHNRSWAALGPRSQVGVARVPWSFGIRLLWFSIPHSLDVALSLSYLWRHKAQSIIKYHKAAPSGMILQD